MNNPLEQLGQQARAAAAQLAQTTATQKNAAITAIIDGLKAAKPTILAANKQDVTAARANGMTDVLIDRLMLDDKRLDAIIQSLNVIQSLPEPVGQLLETTTRPNGLRIEKRAVPIGVIGIIFEARPNVAVDAAALCLKSGNACILRGGSDSWNSVRVLIGIVQDALVKAGLPHDAVQTLPSGERTLVGALLTLDKYVDVIIPRGGKSLIARVRDESRIPVFSHLDGICHTYIDAKANAAKAVAITVNAKMRRTSICGATECLLLHKNIAASLGKDIIAALLQAGCEVRGPGKESGVDFGSLLPNQPLLKLASASDYGLEFLAPIIAVAIVPDVQGAVGFINQYGSQHTDAIVTEDAEAADYFLRHVDSAIVLHNASTQFADGGEFGKGAEIGIATGKLHARGPVGLEELTTYQYRVHGSGQVRG